MTKIDTGKKMIETGISLKLRMAADSLHIAPRPMAQIIALLREAADEADRFNEGMRAWKQAAETKDAKLCAEMTDRINERVAARLAAAPTDSRAAFESHFKLTEQQRARYSVGDYRDSSVNDKWLGWQAAKGEGK